MNRDYRKSTFRFGTIRLHRFRRGAALSLVPCPHATAQDLVDLCDVANVLVWQWLGPRAFVKEVVLLRRYRDLLWDYVQDLNYPHAQQGESRDKMTFANVPVVVGKNCQFICGYREASQ